MLRILHLTDFHLNNKTLNDWNAYLKAAIVNKLKDLQKEKKIDLVIFTGDMIDQGGADFGSVTSGLNKFKENIIDPIRSELELDTERFVICPGNHDINRKADKPFHDIGLKSELVTIDKINDFINQDEADYDGVLRIKEYKDFEYSLYHEVVNKVHGKFKFSIKTQIGNKSIGISSINSSWRCSGETDFKNVLIGESQLNNNYQFVKDCDVSIALLHHQLDWLADSEVRTIKKHISANYDLIFSGHVHETDVEYVHNPTGKSLRIVSPSGLNKIRQNEVNYVNGFSLIDYEDDNVKCHFFKYNFDQRIFVENTDVCDKGIFEYFTNKNEPRKNLVIDEDFWKFLNDSGANFTHRSKTLTLDDIYVAPFMEKFSLNEDEEKGKSYRSQEILKQITSKEIFHSIILGEENSGKTSFCKQIYKNVLTLETAIPIYIKGRDIKKANLEDVRRLLDKEYRKQYKEYVPLLNNSLVIIIDDLNDSKLPTKSKRNFITNLQSLNFQTIITWDEYFTLSEMMESYLTTVEVYEILKFGTKKRLELIRKWIELIDDEFEDETTKEFQIKELSKTINAVIGKNLIPSLPIYILTILQANELSNATNFEQSTFGHYYDVLIRSALGQKVKSNAEIEKYYSYLTELAYWIYSKKTIEIDEEDFIEFHKKFIAKYRVILSFRDALSILEQSNLISNNADLYRFKYKYIYFYFIGKYLSDNIEDEDVQKEIVVLSGMLYQTEIANIYIFLSHHSKSKFVLDNILDRAKELFMNEITIGFNSDISRINSLIQETTEKITLSDEHEHFSDEEDVVHNENLALEVEPANNDVQEGDDIDSISKINKAFKTIEILGYIIKNRYASLKGTEKALIVEELYSLGLRSLTFIFKTLLDGEDYIKNELIDLIKKDPNSALTTRERESLAKQVMFNLLYMVSYSIFKRISSSISSRDLDITFQDVKQKLDMSTSGEQNNAIALIDMAVIFEYSKSFPAQEVESLAKKLKSNHLSFNILRRLGINFMRMIPMKESEQQKAGDILGISINRQRYIGATSSIKK